MQTSSAASSLITDISRQSDILVGSIAFVAATLRELVKQPLAGDCCASTMKRLGYLGTLALVSAVGSSPNSLGLNPPTLSLVGVSKLAPTPATTTRAWGTNAARDAP